MTTILIKKKDTAGAPAAGDLTNAAGGTEIAVNTATKRIYTKDAAGNVVELGTNASASTVADLTVTNTLTVSGTVTSNLKFTDNTYDIGASGATRPRSIFLAGNATVGGLTSGRVTFAGTGGLLSDSANLTWDGTTLSAVGRLYNGDASTFGASTWGMSLGNGGVSANYFKASTTYWQNNAGTQILQLSAGALALAGSANAIYSGVGTTGWSGFAVDTTGGNAIFGVDDSTGSTFGTEAYATIVKSTSKPIYFKNGNTTIGSWNTTSLAVVGAGSYTGNVTIGNASAATNVALNLNGVVNKAQRIVFQNSGVEQWLIGAGAASETSAFEIYNSNGTMELSINKSTSVATFAGGTLSVTGTGSRGVRLTGKGAGEVAIGGDGSTYVLAHNFYNTTGYSTQLGGLYVYAAGGVFQYLSIGPSYNSQNSLYVNSSGNVGVGFSTAAQKLDINGALRFTPNTADTNYSADIFANYDSGHPFQINVKNNGTSQEFMGVYADSGGGNERVVFPTGYVGINITAPKTRLDVRGTSATVGSTIQIVGNSVSTLLLGQNADGGVIRGQGGNNVLSFWTGGLADTAASGSGTERGRFSSGGEFLVGTTSASGSLSNYAPAVVGQVYSYTQSFGATTAGTNCDITGIPVGSYLVTVTSSGTYHSRATYWVGAYDTADYGYATLGSSGYGAAQTVTVIGVGYANITFRVSFGQNVSGVSINFVRLG